MFQNPWPALSGIGGQYFSESVVKIDQNTQLFSQAVLWYKTCPDALVLMVLVRDPKGREPDDFFFILPAGRS